MISPEAVYFFNRENVSQVLFKGFLNDKEREFAEHYDQMIEENEIPKGTVD
ncbi:DUF4176 domain-containing protein [Listeria aquatica]|uniref:Uncharacterized protein n=1 Tax=Listeria aquatica FSL S10-1188 TaxID=1265818 RepID=W7AUX7_9LIST|nr:DUF4176 domain-containing protein [Listeria aquatica]EUJ18934.1 hypothetical protein MAQA_07538 [Listeria aquatica FSL S10-1188]